MRSVGANGTRLSVNKKHSLQRLLTKLEFGKTSHENFIFSYGAPLCQDVLFSHRATLKLIPSIVCHSPAH